MNVFGKLKHYRTEPVIYEDGTVSTWWKIKLYIDGILWDEFSTQYHEEEAKRITRRCNFYAYLQYLEDKCFICFIKKQ